jgi:CRISPR-associated RAMP protein (TIGR02581 family)
MTDRYIFTGYVETLTGLHIGSGGGDWRTDAAVVKDARGRPYIPGSSFKGALRSAVERLVFGWPGVSTCQLTSGRADCLSVNREWQHQFQAEQERGASDERLEELLTLEYPLCDTCQLFGSPFRESRVRVSDLPLQTDFAPEVRHGVGIDRDTGAARENILFDYETVATQNRFRFELTAEISEILALGLLALGLREMQLERVTLGGRASRGLGHCKLHIEHIARVNLGDPQAVLAYLATPDRFPSALEPGKMVDDFLLDQIKAAFGPKPK